jgi:hypothetical protein
MNYREAAIYLEEGANNEQFCTHPKRTESLPAYLMAHAKWYEMLELIVSFLLLSLTAIEPPTMKRFQVWWISGMVNGWSELALVLFAGTV